MKKHQKQFQNIPALLKKSLSYFYHHKFFFLINKSKQETFYRTFLDLLQDCMTKLDKNRSLPKILWYTHQKEKKIFYLIFFKVFTYI